MTIMIGIQKMKHLMKKNGVKVMMNNNINFKILNFFFKESNGYIRKLNSRNKIIILFKMDKYINDKVNANTKYYRRNKKLRLNVKHAHTVIMKQQDPSLH